MGNDIPYLCDSPYCMVKSAFFFFNPDQSGVRGENGLDHGTRKNAEQTAMKFAMARNKVDDLYIFKCSVTTAYGDIFSDAANPFRLEEPSSSPN